MCDSQRRFTCVSKNIKDDAMDTVEEINGTYFYHGHNNLSARELFNLIFLENFSKAFGLSMTSGALILSGQPLMSVSGKLDAAHNTPGTSVASVLSRKLLKDARFPFGLRPVAPVGSFNKLKMVPSNKIATFVGRYIPWIGYANAVVTIQRVLSNTKREYNLIVRPRDRIQWTAF